MRPSVTLAIDATCTAGRRFRPVASGGASNDAGGGVCVCVDTLLPSPYNIMGVTPPVGSLR